MSDLAIKVEGLSKRYRIGQYVGSGRYQYKTLRDVLTDFVYAPFRRLRVKGKQQAADSSPTSTGREPTPNPQHLSPSFIWALRNVSFQVKQGEVVGIIGGNGAGKTTLLKVLSRITEPTEGRVEIKGRLISLLEIGTGFHPELTGRENIYLSGAILGMTKKEIDRKFDEIVAFAELEKFTDTPVKRYSSGMWVRLGFAVAAHLEPEILLVDEVLAVGDIGFQKRCLGKMGDVAKEGRTVLFVSHNMGPIESLCQQSILLESGSIACMGNTKNVMNEYLKQSSREMEVPIGARKDRRGIGKLKFTNIIVNDQKIRDQLLQIDLFIHNATRDRFNNVLLSIVINDYLGRQISNLVNYIVNKPIFISIDGSTVRVNIKNLNLVPGTYYISIFMSSDKQNSEIFDWVINAAKFEVPDYDYYQKGRSPYIKGETIYMDYDYENL